jgi:hypothetical protein
MRARGHAVQRHRQHLPVQQRDEPAHRPGEAQRSVTPPHRLGKLQARDEPRQPLGQHVRRRPARGAGNREHVPALLRLPNLQLVHADALAPGEAQRGLGGRARLVEGDPGRRTLHFPHQILLTGRQPEHQQRQPPRRALDFQAVIGQAQVGQLLFRGFLHLAQGPVHEPGGQLLGADFHQKVQLHDDAPSRRSSGKPSFSLWAT